MYARNVVNWKKKRIRKSLHQARFRFVRHKLKSFNPNLGVRLELVRSWTPLLQHNHPEKRPVIIGLTPLTRHRTLLDPGESWE
jgi:hypothetical protein